MLETMSSSRPPLVLRYLVVLVVTLNNHETTTKLANSSYVSHSCQNSTNFSPNSTYQSNVNSLLGSLNSSAAHADGFSYATYGHRLSDLVFGLFLCRGDVAAPACQRCVFNASEQMMRKCPGKKVALIWYDECMVRYSDESIYAVLSLSLMMVLPGQVSVDSSRADGGDDQFALSLGGFISSMALRAVKSETRKFAAGKQNLSDTETVYVLVQCTPDLTAADCSKCFRSAIDAIRPSGGQRSAKILMPSCFVMYDLKLFFNASALESPLPAPSSPGKSGKKTSVITVATVVPIVGIVLLSALASFSVLRRRAKKMYNALITQENCVSDMAKPESLQFDFRSIEIATSNFSDCNKLGKGGFGEVYKGILLDGREIAVKRLSKSSVQGEAEFKNEVVLLVKLQHRNLVRLLGFCLEGDEKLLVYEYVPNKSLDSLLFDSDKQGRLNWSMRCNIIEGIARGIMYLHEDSRLKIIHRDLKASNILLDINMSPKVSDFGMAKMFGVDQTQGTTKRIVGTYGYMAPEYAMEGLYSIKSDVYSFGVLLLEILSGRKNSSFHISDSSTSLVAYAWQLWNERKMLDLMDPCLKDSCHQGELLRYIQIGLLCVQEDALLRPTMSSVVLMLKSEAQSLSEPQRPAFVSRRSHTGHHEIITVNGCSVNGITVSEFLPR